MADGLTHDEIMEIANKAKPIDAQQVFSIVDNSVKKKTIALESKIDALTLTVGELKKMISKLSK